MTALRVAITGLIVVGFALIRPDIFMRTRDFVEYYSAARVVVSGGDPYDGKQLLTVQRELTGDPDLKEAVSLWTPPWTLAIYLPFGFLKFEIAHLLWVFVQAVVIALSLELLWRALCLQQPPSRHDRPSAEIMSPPPQGGRTGVAGIEADGSCNDLTSSPLEGEEDTTRGRRPNFVAGGGCKTNAINLNNLWPVPYLAAVLFSPVIWNLHYGQNTGFLLLGLAGFLYYRADRAIPAGIFAALTAIKPHLLAVFGVLMICDAMTRSGRRVLIAEIVTLILASLVALAIQPKIFAMYVDSLGRPKSPEAIPLSHWQVPLLSYHFRMAVDQSQFALQFLPCACVCLVAVGYYWKRWQLWDWKVELPRVVLVSLLFAPYGGWIFDLTILLLVVVDLLVKCTQMRWMIYAPLIIVLLFVSWFGLNIRQLHDPWWFTPAVGSVWLLGYVLTPHPQPLSRKGRGESE